MAIERVISSSIQDSIPMPALLRRTTRLQREFYARSPIDVARDCLGKVLVHNETAGRIIETEAYLGVGDLAAHAASGITARTRVLFGAPGHAYVYFIYGRYDCLNFVAEREGAAGCVLIRALEPLTGIASMIERRAPRRQIAELASGPGKLTIAMGITRALNGSDLIAGPLQVRGFRDEPAVNIVATPRIGITKCVDWPLRFVLQPSMDRR